jgi:hypothetical protein
MVNLSALIRRSFRVKDAELLHSQACASVLCKYSLICEVRRGTGTKHWLTLSVRFDCKCRRYMQ